MAKEEEQMRKSENQSMRKSRVGNRYFKIDPGYDKAVYENTIGNWFKIIGAFIVFYIIVAFFWWACYSHGIRDVTSATWIYIGVLLISWIIIVILIIVGTFSNSKLQKADRLMLEVNELKKLKAEDEEKKEKREEAKKELKRLEREAKKDSDSDTEQRNSRESEDEGSRDESGDDEEGEEDSEVPSSRSD
jgi:amino acid permease